MTAHHESTIREFERFIRRDPAGRGLISTEAEFGPLCPGHLAGAARSIAESGTGAIIATGFYIPHGEVPACETDGPIGAMLLAVVLQGCGIPTVVVTDEFCAGAVEATARFFEFPLDSVLTLRDVAAGWLPAISALLPEPSHLIAVERVGPCHTSESLGLFYGAEGEHLQRYRTEVPTANHGRCHNMRGEIIDDFTPPLHDLFEQFPRAFPHGRTIGIGDGGNEIGMGAIPWHELRRRLPGAHAGRIPCRLATDWTILAGVSNWGAYALAAAVALLRERVRLLESFDSDHQERLLDHLLQAGPAVCGITGRREPMVDGLPFVTYIQPWAGIRRLLGLDE